MPAICCDIRYQGIEKYNIHSTCFRSLKIIDQLALTLDAFVLLGCPQQRIQDNHLPPVFNLYLRALSTYVTLVANVYHSY